MEYIILEQCHITPRETDRQNDSIRPCLPCWEPCRKTGSRIGQTASTKSYMPIIVLRMMQQDLHIFSYFMVGHQDFLSTSSSDCAIHRRVQVTRSMWSSGQSLWKKCTRLLQRERATNFALEEREIERKYIVQSLTQEIECLCVI